MTPDRSVSQLYHRPGTKSQVIGPGLNSEQVVGCGDEFGWVKSRHKPHVRVIISLFKPIEKSPAKKAGQRTFKQHCLSDADCHPGRDVACGGGPKLLKRAFCSSVKEE